MLDSVTVGKADFFATPATAAIVANSPEPYDSNLETKRLNALLPKAKRIKDAQISLWTTVASAQGGGI